MKMATRTVVNFAQRTETEEEIIRNLNKIDNRDLQYINQITKLLVKKRRNFNQITQELAHFVVKLNSLVRR